MTGPTLFIKKPIKAMAIQYTGANDHDIIEFTDGVANIYQPVIDGRTMDAVLVLRTGERLAPQVIRPSDWIVRDFPGVFRLHPPQDFVELYEPASVGAGS